MSNPVEMQQQSNTEVFYEVARSDLPVHCPLPGTTLWNSHPRVYLSFDEKGEARCPYCGALYRVKEQ